MVRFPSEKLGGRSITSDIVGFSKWINRHSLIDLHLGGSNFTWSNHQSSPAMYSLDRFLLFCDWFDLFPEACQFALPNPISDHCPILLDTICERWGPPPFRFELMWLDEPNFSTLLRKWWQDTEVGRWAGLE